MQHRPGGDQAYEGAREALRIPLGSRGRREPSRLGRAIAVSLVVVAVGCAAAPLTSPVRAAIALALVLLAMASSRFLGQRAREPRGFVVVDERGVMRVDAGGSSTIAAWSEPFGLSVLAHPSRTRAVLAFTSPARTRYLGVRVDGDEDPREAEALLACASSVPATEVDEVLGRSDATLSASAANRIVRALMVRSAAALERIYLTDARGEPVVLDGPRLRLGARTIDLASPLEWRGFTFHESTGQLSAFFQATWVRQDGAEAVLVAPLPNDAARPTDARTRRILQWTPEAPPPKELRVAIDRLFMLPLRSALDRAPRISRHPSSGPRSLPEKRA